MKTTLAPYRFTFRHACRLRDRIMDAVATDGYEATLSEIVNTFYDPPQIKDQRAARLVNLIGAIYPKTELRDIVENLFSRLYVPKREKSGDIRLKGSGGILLGVAVGVGAAAVLGGAAYAYLEYVDEETPDEIIIYQVGDTIIEVIVEDGEVKEINYRRHIDVQSA
jgi:hypothetical protein